MKRSKKNAFTLIELVAVLVIMAIIALIVTPLVMSIIRKAKVSADKRSIDAYGRSIELAIAGYLMDTGSFPTDINQLTIEYSGDEVVCTTTQINPDSSVYLSNCKVNNRDVANYTYGSDNSPSYTVYNVGDEVTYNNVNYYVIKDSGAKESTVTLLKAEPLSVAEVNLYGVGHINSNTDVSRGKVYDSSGYGGIVYYSSLRCGYDDKGTWNGSDCTTDYAQSEVKYVVDAWKNEKASAATEARLMTYEEALEYSEIKQECTGECYNVIGLKYNWMYNNNYWYWLSTPYTDSSSSVWKVNRKGILDYNEVYTTRNNFGVVRPVIVLPKSAL